MELVALDPGYGFIKLATVRGAVVLPSAVAVPTGGAIRRRIAGLRVAKPPLEVITDQGRFFVGDGAHDWGVPIENLDFDRLTGSPEMRALLYAAFGKAQLSGEIRLIVGLPLEALATAEVVRAVKAFLQGRHAWQMNGQGWEVTVTRVSITAQPVGGVFDYFLDDDGEPIPERSADFKKEIGIVNVGMNTVDLLVVRDGTMVSRFTRGEKLGVRRLFELLNHEGLYSLTELDERLRCGELDISEATPIWAQEVLGFIESKWGKAVKRFARVIAVGGGVVLLGHHLASLPRVWVPPEPVLAQVRGLLKYALGKEKRQAA
mgnify:CR=1 FL=1|jgi:hypothetical protein